MHVGGRYDIARRTTEDYLMPASEKRTFSLPATEAAFIDAQVASGAFASASEVVRAGLQALQERDAAEERSARRDARFEAL